MCVCVRVTDYGLYQLTLMIACICCGTERQGGTGAYCSVHFLYVTKHCTISHYLLLAVFVKSKGLNSVNAGRFVSSFSGRTRHELGQSTGWVVADYFNAKLVWLG